MKKSVYFVLIVQLILPACNSSSEVSGSFLDEYIAKFDEPIKNVCKSAADAFKFPVDWTKKDLDYYDNLTEIFFRSMSTCGLLETQLEHPLNRLGPWASFCWS